MMVTADALDAYPPYGYHGRLRRADKPKAHPP